MKSIRSLGCCYVQGFYYARPMPVKDYEVLLDGTVPVPTRLDSENLERLNKTIWASNPQTELLFNSMQQPSAVCEVENNHFRALLENPRFSEFVGYGPRIDSRIPATCEKCKRR